MKAPVACPNCDSSFSISRENEGKRAKCPKCAQPFVISFAPIPSPDPDFPDVADTSPPPVPPTFASAPAQPVETTPQIQTTSSEPDSSKRRLSSKRTFTLPQWAVIALPAICTLVLGYFIGREHLKYQMRSAFTDAAEAFSKGLGGGNDGPSFASSEPATEPIPQLLIGETHQSDGFAITLTNAKIAISQVKDMMGETRTGKSPDLALSFTFANTDDRKILRFRKGNQFMAGHFRLRDDVDNTIRGIDYGITSKPIGALTGSEDISPGSTASHLELFSVPPPKTEYLILTVNLACKDSPANSTSATMSELMSGS